MKQYAAPKLSKATPKTVLPQHLLSSAMVRSMTSGSHCS